MENQNEQKLVTMPVEVIEHKIFVIRGHKVILDYDLAMLYEVKTHRLKEQVKRNIEKFPDDFMFELTKEEKEEVLANCENLSNLKFSPALTMAFTEHGVLQAANVLNNPRANQVSIQVIRIFNKLRNVAFTNQEIKAKLKELEDKFDAKFADSDQSFKAVFEMLNHILYPPEKPKKIGFVRGDE